MGRRSPDGPNPQKKDFHGYDSRSTPSPWMGFPFPFCTSPGRSPGAACNQRNMLIQRRPSGVEIRAPAKVNLFLEVLAKRPDGYHDIATLMTAVSLYDTLEFTEEPSLELRCDDPSLDCGPTNLVCRAAERLRQHTGTKRGARIHLRKRIPMAAGLAGGSSDAAATLAGLNELWGLGLKSEALARIGSEIGSDVAFFFATPAAWCTGRGEIVTSVKLARPLDLLLVCPPMGLATADVYRNVTVPQRPESGDEIRQAAAAGDVEEMGRRLHNRLQPAAEKLCPPIAAWQSRLEQLHPVGTAMSGSGSSLFALCRNRLEALAIARELRRPARETESTGGRMFLVRSCV